MFQIRRFLVCLASAILIAATVSGESAPIRVGVAPFSPFVIEAGDTPTGFDIDLIEAIASDLGVACEFGEPMPLTQLLAAVEDGEIDAAIAGISITADREEMMRREGEKGPGLLNCLNLNRRSTSRA